MDENVDIPRISVREYLEYFLSEYGKLTRIELTILIHRYVKSEFSVEKDPKKLKATISVALGKLQQEGKVSKVGNMKWEWVNKTP